jgi:hypothetical protein
MSNNLNAGTFVVIGDGLSAGAGDFGLSEQLQAFSFPAQFAGQLHAPFSQPLIQGPGLGPVIGFPDLPVSVPQAMQTTVLKEFPPADLFSNLSIPGLRLIDALTRRPASPLIHRSDALQTAINLILGLPGLMTGGTQPLPTQLEYALSRQPTLALIALGYVDVLDAAFKGSPASLPDDVSFRVNYGHVLQAFSRTRTAVIACTVPDPADTAYFTPVSAAARVVKAEPDVLARLFDLAATDALTPGGLVEAGCRLIARRPSPLPEASVVPGSVVARISERVATLNTQIRALVQEGGALLFDLHAVFRRFKQDGIAAGSRRLTSDYLGGVYSLNGVYPGATGHGAIANALIDVVNARFDTSTPHIDLGQLAAADPVAIYAVAGGPSVTVGDLASMPPSTPSAARAANASPLRPRPRATADDEPARLALPPGLEQELPIDVDSSYFGDALRAAHATEARDVEYGSTPNLLYGGVCLLQSHLQGTVRITFTPPAGDLTHFEVTHGQGLVGDDTMLTAPQFLKLPALMNRVSDAPGLVSSGELNLATGEVTHLSYAVTFMNSALMALAAVNPHMPPTPVAFPGQYGSAWARFEPRDDGRLDFTFSGMTFMPLGAGFGGDTLRFPLPFAGPSMQFASIPSVGSARHPHLHISTRAPGGPSCAPRCPDIPTNTIREYTTFTCNTAVGDTFSPNVPEMESGATEPSHPHNRLLIQFGERSRDTVPIAVTTLVPGGLLAAPPESPFAARFPGRLPFEFSIGAVDVKTGNVLGSLQHRGLIVRDVLLMDGFAPPPAGKSGSARSVVASNGQKFSYSYSMPGQPAGKAASFEYWNETTGGAFRMGSLLWLSFGHSSGPATSDECDVVSFTGMGTWNQDPRPHIATVQASTAPGLPYVSIQIDGGMASNVNTKPPKAGLSCADARA